jgi:hypothetical protein
MHIYSLRWELYVRSWVAAVKLRPSFRPGVGLLLLLRAKRSHGADALFLGRKRRRRSRQVSVGGGRQGWQAKEHKKGRKKPIGRSIVRGRTRLREASSEQETRASLSEEELLVREKERRRKKNPDTV